MNTKKRYDPKMFTTKGSENLNGNCVGNIKDVLERNDAFGLSHCILKRFQRFENNNVSPHQGKSSYYDYQICTEF